MARYIDADKVMEEIASMGGHDLCEWSTLVVKVLINRQPTADVAPRAEWISVEERWPEESCECLAVSGTGVIYLLHYSHKYKAFNATDDEDGDRWKLGGITHWMPLPEPPVMKGE